MVSNRVLVAAIPDLDVLWIKADTGKNLKEESNQWWLTPMITTNFSEHQVGKETGENHGFPPCLATIYPIYCEPTEPYVRLYIYIAIWSLYNYI